MDQTNDFWDTALQVWEQGFFGHSFRQILVAAAIFIVFMLLRHILSRYALKRVARILDESEAGIDGNVIMAIEKPISLIPIAFVLKQRMTAESMVLPSSPIF